MKRVVAWILVIALAVGIGFGLGALTYEPPAPELDAPVTSSP
jgi:hypothetical protein